MKHTYRSISMCATLLGVSLLSACSIAPPKPKPDFDKPKHSRMQKDSAFAQTFKHACDGKSSGENLQIQVDNRVIEGQCQLQFQPKPPQL